VLIDPGLGEIVAQLGRLLMQGDREVVAQSRHGLSITKSHRYMLVEGTVLLRMPFPTPTQRSRWTDLCSSRLKQVPSP
jgi:hypothetical protein